MLDDMASLKMSASGGVLMKTGIVVGLLAALAFASSARAENLEKARAALRDANQHYDLGEYQQALDKFKEAYRNHEEPALLFNIAQCERLLGQNEEAAREYRMYLIKVPKAPNRDAVRALIDKLDATIKNDNATKNAPPQGSLATAPPREAPASPAPPGEEPSSAAPLHEEPASPLPAHEQSAAPPPTLPATREPAADRPPPSPPPQPAAGRIESHPTPEAAAAPLVAQHDARPPVYRRWWLWTAVGAVAVAVGVGVGVALAPGPSAPAMKTSAGVFRF